MKKSPFIALLSVTALSGCTSQSLYEISNDLWCDYQDNTTLDPEKEIFPGEKRKPFPKKCSYISYADYQQQKSELDSAVEKQNQKANM